MYQGCLIRSSKPGCAVCRAGIGYFKTLSGAILCVTQVILECLVTSSCILYRTQGTLPERGP
jgi:hypothetical protein